MDIPEGDGRDNLRPVKEVLVIIIEVVVIVDVIVVKRKHNTSVFHVCVF